MTNKKKSDKIQLEKRKGEKKMFDDFDITITCEEFYNDNFDNTEEYEEF